MALLIVALPTCSAIVEELLAGRSVTPSQLVGAQARPDVSPWRALAVELIVRLLSTFFEAFAKLPLRVEAFLRQGEEGMKKPVRACWDRSVGKQGLKQIELLHFFLEFNYRIIVNKRNSLIRNRQSANSNILLISYQI